MTSDYYAKKQAAFSDVKWWLLLQAIGAPIAHDRLKARQALAALEQCEVALALQVLKEATDGLKETLHR